MRLELWLADWKRDAWTLCGDCRTGIDVATWSPDGVRVLLGQNERLVAHALDGSAPDEVLATERGRALVPGPWLADGRIVYQSSPDLNLTNYEIKLLEQGGGTGRVLVPLGVGKAPEVSPDGRWLAYDSVQTGAREVIVQAFPGPGSRTQVSAGGGPDPASSADGGTLYYLRPAEPGGSAVVAVDIAASSVFTVGKPHELFRRPDSQTCGTTRCYDISADGQRFLFRDFAAKPRGSATRMDLVLNWTTTLSNAR
jgi:Tol biopolymer transport system component